MNNTDAKKRVGSSYDVLAGKGAEMRGLLARDSISWDQTGVGEGILKHYQYLLNLTSLTPGISHSDASRRFDAGMHALVACDDLFRRVADWEYLHDNVWASRYSAELRKRPPTLLQSTDTQMDGERANAIFKRDSAMRENYHDVLLAGRNVSNSMNDCLEAVEFLTYYAHVPVEDAVYKSHTGSPITPNPALNGKLRYLHRKFEQNPEYFSDLMTKASLDITRFAYMLEAASEKFKAQEPLSYADPSFPRAYIQEFFSGHLCQQVNAQIEAVKDVLDEWRRNPPSPSRQPTVTKLAIRESRVAAAVATNHTANVVVGDFRREREK